MSRTCLLALALVLTWSGGGCVNLAGGGPGSPGTCGNDQLDPDESDIDCGGRCGPCSSGEKCRTAGDCADGNCNAAGRCMPTGSSCFDNVKDGPETDKDCGGGCAKCANGQACAVASDCEGGSCVAGTCQGDAVLFPFAPARFADAGRGATSLAVADLDGDGRLDAVTANSAAGNISVLGGGGDGTFKSSTFFGTFSQPGWVGIADLDEDGRPDVVLVSRGNSGFALMRNRGNLDFGGDPVRFLSPLTDRPVAAALADFDGDGHIDVALSAGSGQVILFRSRGGGRFEDGRGVGPPGIGPSQLAAGDLDGDGRPDLAVVADMIVKLMLGASFASSDAPALPIQPMNVTLAALRAGGPRDLVVSGSDGDVAVLLGRGDGGFGEATTYRTGNQPFAVAPADFDGDGHIDLAVCNEYLSDMSLLGGHGDGTFEPAVRRWLGGSPRDMVAADMNSDGRPDIVMCDSYQHDVGVLLNLRK